MRVAPGKLGQQWYKSWAGARAVLPDGADSLQEGAAKVTEGISQLESGGGDVGCAAGWGVGMSGRSESLMDAGLREAL